MARRSRRGGRGRQQKRSQDHYGRRARRDGFPARSVYKLEEIDRRCHLLRRGQRVLDLGASPGSWTLYAAQKVDREGKVLGLDLAPHRGALPENATIEVRDVEEVSAADLGGSGAFDVVLSDMAPSTIGHRGTDMARSYRLFMRALDLATAVLAPGGAFVGKIFQGEDFPEAQKAMKERFEEVKVVRPSATRDVSYEVFLVGKRLKATASPREANPTP